jgi:type IV pilus assembly protein PilF
MKNKVLMNFVFILLSSFMVSACQTIAENEITVKKVSAAKINDQLGMAYLERRDIQRAKQKFLLALEQAPKLPEAWYSMAYFLEATGNNSEANKHYLKAITLAPNRGDVLNNYGTYLCRIGHNKQAIDYFMKAARDSEYLDIAGAYENAGICSVKYKQNKIAKAYFIKALTEDSERSTSLVELAELYYKEGKYKDAKNNLNRFLKISSPTVQSYQLAQKLESKLS